MIHLLKNGLENSYGIAIGFDKLFCWYKNNSKNLLTKVKNFCQQVLHLSGEFIAVMNMHSFPVHEQYIEYSSVLLAFYDSSVIEDRKIGSVSFSKVKVNIVIFITTINLFPDAGFDLFLFIFPDQAAEALIGESEELVHIFISGHMKELMVCIKEFVIIFVRPVYDKCTRKVFRDILKCESQLFTDS